MWRLVLFAILCLQAFAIDYKDQHVLTTLSELVIMATIPSPSYKGQSVTFSVEHADGSSFSANETFQWKKNGQVVSNLASYTMVGTEDGPQNISVSLSVEHLIATTLYFVEEIPLVIYTSVHSPCLVGQNVNFSVQRQNGSPFSPAEHFEWRVDGKVVGSDAPNFTMISAVVGVHNVTVRLSDAQLQATTLYAVEQKVVAISITAKAKTQGNLTIVSTFTGASSDIMGNLTYWLNGLKIGATSFKGPSVNYVKSLPLPVSPPATSAWLYVRYEGNAIYEVATSNYLHIFANGTVISDDSIPPPNSWGTSDSTGSPSTASSSGSSSSHLSRTSIILIAIAASVLFFICCVFCIARRGSQDTVIHDSLNDH